MTLRVSYNSPIATILSGSSPRPLPWGIGLKKYFCRITIFLLVLIYPIYAQSFNEAIKLNVEGELLYSQSKYREALPFLSEPLRSGKPTAEAGQVTGQVELESGAESSLDRLLNYLAKNPHSKSEVAFHLGQKGVAGPLNRTVKQLFEEGLIETTIPDKPNSRLQKYRLTEKGRQRKSEV